MPFSTIFSCIVNRCLSLLKLWVRIPLRQHVLNTTLCDYVCQWLAADLWFSPGTLVTSTNKTDCHDIIEIRSNLILFGICCIIFYIVFFIWQSTIIWLHLILCTLFVFIHMSVVHCKLSHLNLLLWNCWTITVIRNFKCWCSTPINQ
jgi:hypothetical protein